MLLNLLKLILLTSFFIPRPVHGQVPYQVSATSMSKDGGRSTVLLLDMVHFGPYNYYADLGRSLESYAAGKQDIAVLMEGVSCRGLTFDLIDTQERWPFPTLGELQANFSSKELLEVQRGQLSFKFYSFFRQTFAKNIQQYGVDYFFYRRSCAPKQLVSREAAGMSRNFQSIEDLYESAAERVSMRTGIPTITQNNAQNPLWSTMYRLKNSGRIKAVVMSDLDKSSIDPRDIEQLIWLARLSIQEAAPKRLNPAFGYLSHMWNTINQRGFRNQIVIEALAGGVKQGYRHFVLPWGESHREDLVRRLAEMGFKPQRTQKILYAHCPYMRVALEKDSCTLSNP